MDAVIKTKIIGTTTIAHLILRPVRRFSAVTPGVLAGVMSMGESWVDMGEGDGGGVNMIF